MYLHIVASLLVSPTYLGREICFSYMNWRKGRLDIGGCAIGLIDYGVWIALIFKCSIAPAPLPSVESAYGFYSSSCATTRLFRSGIYVARCICITGAYKSAIYSFFLRKHPGLNILSFASAICDSCAILCGF